MRLPGPFDKAPKSRIECYIRAQSQAPQDRRNMPNPLLAAWQTPFETPPFGDA